MTKEDLVFGIKLVASALGFWLLVFGGCLLGA